MNTTKKRVAATKKTEGKMPSVRAGRMPAIRKGGTPSPRKSARRGSRPAATLQIGVGTADITPAHPELLSPTGMGRLVPTRGVLDGLRVEALAIRAGGDLAFITTSDLRTLFMEGSAVKEIAAKVAARTGCDPHKVLLSAVHNHCSSPIAADDSPAAQAALKAANRRIVDGFAEACAKAADNLRPAEIAAATATLAQPVGRNRRMILSNGTGVNCWGAGPMIPFGHRAVGPAGPDSTRLDLLAVREVGRDRPFAILTCYPTHPHLYELPYFSGEFPGAVKRRIERAFPGAVSLHANATGGDIDLHEVHPMTDYEPQQVRWFRDSAELLADRFVRAALPAVPTDGFRRPGAMRHEYYTSGPHESRGSQRLTVLNALALGEFAFVSMPGELFLTFGLEIIDKSPFPHTLLMGYNGSREGYAPLPIVFEQGSYEVMRGRAPDVDPENAPLNSIHARPWTGQRITARTLEILNRLKDEA